VYAADTNVVVRVLVGDDAEQRARVLSRLRELLEAGDGVVVGVVVLAEVAWVLDRAYGYQRSQIAAALRAVMSTPPFVVPRRAELLTALEMYEQGPADFSDYLILALARTDGCTTLLTFDGRLLRHPECQAP
jgi:predicted nucleic-acid-binding protein